LEITLASDHGAERYSSRIEEITDHQLHLAMPMSKNVPILLVPGTKFLGRIVSEEAVWEFTSTYIDKMTTSVPVWIVSSPTEVKKKQQRSFVRMQIAMPMKVSYRQKNGLENTNSDDIVGTALITVTTKDIGGGGILFVTKTPLKIGVTLRVGLDLILGNSVEATGEVVRLLHAPDTTLKIYYVAIRFIDISEKERDRIIKFIFKKQIERRKRGL